MKSWVGLEPPPNDLLPAVKGLYPEQALLSEAEWDVLQAHYVARARHEDPSPLPALKVTDQFQAEPLTVPFGPQCMAVYWDKPLRQLWVGHAGERKVFVRESEGNWNAGMDWGGVPARFMARPDAMLAVLMPGYLPGAGGGPAKGKLVQWKQGNVQVLAERLNRPTDLWQGTLRAGQPSAMLWGEFGGSIGGVTMLEEHGRTQWLDWPGVVKLEVADFDGDERLDLVALCGQEKESVVLLRSEADGNRTMEVQLTRHPAWGYTHLEVVDFNQDGHPDLVVTNGDNGDLANGQPRPFHGVRICLNNGKGRFSESTFLPMNGATQAKSGDFDGDGDLDVVAIAHYADFEQTPGRAAMLFRQEADGRFTEWELPGAAKGRWLTMTAGDLDQDGDEDLVLAALNGGPGVGQVPAALRRSWVAEPVALMLLRNRAK